MTSDPEDTLTTHQSALEKGVAVIKRHVKTLPDRPGVYRMLNAKNRVLYVGKALYLKRRVANYTNPGQLSTRLQRMISETASMEFIETKSEVEALLLEANLIKQYDPSYNVRLKDDKFFSYIHLSQHAYPRLSKYRGARAEGGDFFGPFVSSAAIDEALIMLAKTFKLRSCTDSYFNARSRPCLQYHIKRCSAPCVAKISHESYAHNVQQVKRVLEGKTNQVQQVLQTKMDQCSAAMNYEQAAIYRDQIKAITALQSSQSINLQDVKNADFFALERAGLYTCIQGFFYRNGSTYGTHSFFIKESSDLSDEDVLGAFLIQFYADKAPPPLLYLSHTLSDPLIEEALSLNVAHRVTLQHPKRGIKKDVLETVAQNAKAALERDLLLRKNERAHLEALTSVLGLTQPLSRIEVYDNSHIQGTNAIGAMIVSGPTGFDKKGYRKFTIKSTDLTPGDDFGMMREVLERRFRGTLAKDTTRTLVPDLVMIDGGKGQLSAAQGIFDQLGLRIPLLAIAKGPERNAGKETFYTQSHPQGFKLDNQPGLLHYLQRLRDEAHRFAITFHRQKRTAGMKRSILDGLPGVGPSRKRALLAHFGSATAIKAASITDLQSVPGISQSLAHSIYGYLHQRR